MKKKKSILANSWISKSVQEFAGAVLYISLNCNNCF